MLKFIDYFLYPSRKLNYLGKYLNFTDDSGFMNWKELAYILIWWGYLLAGKPKGQRPC